MEMLLRRSALVFFTVAVSAMVISGQSPVILDEDEKTVEIPFGSPLILKCNFSTEGHARFWINWYFRPSGSNMSHSISTRIHNRSAKTEETLLNHTSNATDRSSGWYSCNLTADIPIHKKFVSAETKVAITSTYDRAQEFELLTTKCVEHTTQPSLTIVTVNQATVIPTEASQPFTWWWWILLGASAFVLVVLLVVCILLRRRCRRSRAGAEDPVYANTHRMINKQPSPRPGMPDPDDLKTSSQNLRNPSPCRRYDDSRGRYKK